MEKLKKSFSSSLEAVGELCSVALVFIVIALIAVGLGHFIHWVEDLGASTAVVLLLKFTEHALLVLDVAALLKRVWHHLNS